jgi:hypothetical protein
MRWITTLPKGIQADSEHHSPRRSYAYVTKTGAHDYSIDIQDEWKGDPPHRSPSGEEFKFQLTERR